VRKELYKVTEPTSADEVNIYIGSFNQLWLLLWGRTIDQYLVNLFQSLRWYSSFTAIIVPVVT